MLTVLVIGSAATPALLRAQSANGTIAGHVRAHNGRPLVGATADIEGSTQHAVTDASGYFRLAGVPAGPATVIVRFIGSMPDTLAVTVTAGRTESEDVILQGAAVALAPAVVRERVEGQARALMEQRTANRIVNVTTSDVIQSRPDANLADAVGRLPGVSLERDEGEGKYVQIRGTAPSFSNVTINGAHVPSPEGDTRTVKLDVIPAALVSEVQLSKTLTPNMDADAIGGSVNLTTKTPERGDPVAQLTVLGGHTDLRSNSAYNINGVVGGRFGPEDKAGFLLTGSFDRNNRPIDDVEPVFDVASLGGKDVPIVAELDQRLYSYQRERQGFGGTLDYRMNDQSSVYLQGLYSGFHNYGTRYRADPVPSDGDVTATTPTTGTATGGTMSREVQTRRPAEQIYSFVGGGKHAFNDFTLDYSVSYSHSQQRVTNGRNTVFAMDGIDYSYDASQPNYPKVAVTNGAPTTTPSAFAFDNFDIQNNLTTDGETAAQANVAMPHTWNGNSATFTFGAKVRDESKERANSDSIWNGYNGDFTMADVLSGINDPSFYYDHYAIGPVPDAATADAFENVHRSSFVFDRGKSLARTEGANYSGSEKVYAGYGMESVDIGALNVLAGARVEATQADYTGNVVQLDAKKKYVGSTPVSGSHSYTNVFPTIALKYAVDARSNFRVAATEGIARPAFADLAPYLVTSQGLKTLTQGNPDLQPTHSVNLDVLYDHYDAAVGVFSIGAYYKNITDFIFVRRQLLNSGQYAGYFASQPQNGDNGHILGVEAEYQHRFTALPGGWSGLGIDGNVNFADSKATVPTGDGTSRDAAMPRQGAFNANAEVTYDRGAYSFRGGLTYNAKNVWEYGDDASSDVYLDNHLQFDANATIALSSQVHLVIQALNVTNEVFGFYQGSSATPIQREFYGRTLFLGFRYSN
ncbi:MAG TPA: TonB-dependent receptor [Gemmatimonadaceae bacterium]|nr:TonB-dependent receptor [Gemmatimonadaceae bacterium]